LKSLKEVMYCTGMTENKLIKLLAVASAAALRVWKDK